MRTPKLATKREVLEHLIQNKEEYSTDYRIDASPFVKGLRFNGKGYYRLAFAEREPYHDCRFALQSREERTYVGHFSFSFDTPAWSRGCDPEALRQIKKLVDEGDLNGLLKYIPRSWSPRLTVGLHTDDTETRENKFITGGEVYYCRSRWDYSGPQIATNYCLGHQVIAPGEIFLKGFRVIQAIPEDAGVGHRSVIRS